MNSIKINLCVVLLSAVTLSSCEDFLDTKIVNTFDEEYTWSVGDYALGVLNNAYYNMPTTMTSFNNNYLDVITDNACTSNYGTAVHSYVFGAMTASNNFYDNWETAYKCFQYIHLFLENGLGDNVVYSLSSSSEDMHYRVRSYGESYYLRAWWGLELLSRFGGVSDDGVALGYPIVTEYIPDTDAGFAKYNELPRNTFQECVDQIVADCKVAIEYLPATYDDYNEGVANQSVSVGRATSRGAYAIMSRALLLGASPAYQDDDVSDEVVRERWKMVIDATYEAIGFIGLEYAPLTNDMLVGTSLEYTESSEFLFRRWTNNKNMEQYHFPPMFYGDANTCPSQNLVDAFPTTSGYPTWDSRSGYDPQKPYENRDKRLAVTIYRNDEEFNSTRNLEIFTRADGTLGLDVEGAHYKNSPTGYYLKKGLSSKANMLYDPDNVSTTLNDYHQQPFLRVAELHYNLAEALNQYYGASVSYSGRSALSIMNTIRTANGVVSSDYATEVAAQGVDAFHEFIINERRIEFAFENMRYLDLRRNKMAMDIDIYGVEVTKETSGIFDYNGTGANEDGADSQGRIVVEDRSALSDKYIYIPLPESEMLKNPNLIQNRGW